LYRCQPRPCPGHREIRELMPVKNPTSSESRTGRPTTATSVYDKIRRDIIKGALAPGLKLGSANLRERY